MHNLSSAKKFSLVLGVTGVGLLVGLPFGLPARAQSSSPYSGASTTEIPGFTLSREGYKILCERTPYNSRCEGNTSSAGNTSGSSQRTDEQRYQNVIPDDALTSPSGTTAPTQNLPSESEPPAVEGSPSNGQGNGMGNGMGNDMGRDRMRQGSDGSANSPSNTTAPTQNLPSESDTPSSSEQRGGMMRDQTRPTPNDNIAPGNGNASPSGTSAPTQTLPSEGTTPNPSR